MLTKANLDDFEQRLGERLDQLDVRLAKLEAQSAAVLLLMQDHGTVLGELHGLLPKLIAAISPPARNSRPPGRNTPPPEHASEAP
jgi:hypothetical protein